MRTRQISRLDHASIEEEIINLVHLLECTRRKSADRLQIREIKREKIDLMVVRVFESI